MAVWSATVAAQNRVTVTQREFGDRWPLTVPSATLRCLGRAGTGAIVLDVARKGTYALNGTAKMMAKKDRPLRWKELDDEIWKPNPEVKGLKVSIGPLIKGGLTLCKKT